MKLVAFAVGALVLAVLALGLLVRWMEPRFAFFPSVGEDRTPRDLGIPYESLTLTTSDGEHLRAWRMDAREPRARIVYFHGNAGNLSNWLPCYVDIVRHGYTVLAVDYRGYGASSGRPTERGLYRDADAAAAQPWPPQTARLPLVYWGRSIGTAVAAHAASVRKPDGVVLESGFPNGRAIVRKSPLFSLLALFASYKMAAADSMNRARVPALVIHGDADHIIPYDLGRELFDSIPEPKRFVTIRGGDHNDAIPADPKTYWSGIEAFIESLRPAAS